MKNKIFKKIILAVFISYIFLLCSCKDEIISNDPNNNTVTVIENEPIWSPDGNSIAFIGKNETGESKIFAIDTNLFNRRILKQDYGQSLDWSPDGQWILFERNGVIYKKRITGDTVTLRLTFEGSCFFPAWSKDGEWIAYDTNLESPDGSNFVWKMRSDGSQKKRIIFAPTHGEVRQPSWFPDGIRLAVIRYLQGYGFDSEIAIIDTNGNSISTLTNDPEQENHPKVSPDGQHITWYRYPNGRTIMLMNSDGTQQRQLLTHAVTPNWSPDSQMLVYTNTTYNDGRIWIMNKDGMGRKKISY